MSVPTKGMPLKIENTKKIRKPVKPKKPAGPPEEITDGELTLALSDGEFVPEQLFVLAEQALSRMAPKNFNYSLPASRAKYIFIFNSGEHSINYHDSYDCDYTYGNICVKIKVIDKLYNQELQKYHDKMEIYEEKLEKYHKQYALWELQRKPELLKQKEKRLKDLKEEIKKIDSQIKALEGVNNG